MERYSYKFKNIINAKNFIKRIFKSDIYKYHVRLILKEKHDIFYTSLNSEISTTLEKFNQNLDELYTSYMDRYDTSAQIFLGIEIIIYILKDTLNKEELKNKKLYMDLNQYITENYDKLETKNSIKLINDIIIEKKEKNSLFFFNKIKNSFNNFIYLIKKCIN